MASDGACIPPPSLISPCAPEFWMAPSELWRRNVNTRHCCIQTFNTFTTNKHLATNLCIHLLAHWTQLPLRFWTWTPSVRYKSKLFCLNTQFEKFLSMVAVASFQNKERTIPNTNFVSIYLNDRTMPVDDLSPYIPSYCPHTVF